LRNAGDVFVYHQEEINRLDYANRLKSARIRMVENNIGLMFLNVGANLSFLTGFRRNEPHSTDVNTYGDWAVGGFIGVPGNIVLTAPRMGSKNYIVKAQDKPWFDSVRVILEPEDPLDVMRQILGQFDLRDKKIALDDHTWAATALAFRRLLPEAEFVLASDIIAPLRMIKGEPELDLMRQAGQITDAVFQKALARLKPGVTELDVENEIDYQFRLMGAEYNSFVTDVSFDRPGDDGNETLRTSPKKLTPGCSVTFDLGCVYEGYCSDFGRSAFVGEPPAEYLRVHELVLRAQREAMQAMQAGQITAEQANAIARSVIEAEGYGPYFTHRLGHGIGLTVHEPPYLDTGQRTVLQAGMTFTVEPSINVPNGFNNRVEDVVLVTETGAVSLYTTDHRLYIVE
jgi:Xaa-Pro dipeptidase